ncbi:hypothetical protein HMPREF3038_02626 [Akkermansia sp. KLE1797]|nr:hypothetical protein HMPREF3038_02626 [Akkermansia sp. KLE1797]
MDRFLEEKAVSVRPAAIRSKFHAGNARSHEAHQRRFQEWPRPAARAPHELPGSVFLPFPALYGTQAFQISISSPPPFPWGCPPRFPAPPFRSVSPAFPYKPHSAVNAVSAFRGILRRPPPGTVPSCRHAADTEQSVHQVPPLSWRCSSFPPHHARCGECGFFDPYIP